MNASAAEMLEVGPGQLWPRKGLRPDLIHLAAFLPASIPVLTRSFDPRTIHPSQRGCGWQPQAVLLLGSHLLVFTQKSGQIISPERAMELVRQAILALVQTFREEFKTVLKS